MKIDKNTRIQYCENQQIKIEVNRRHERLSITISEYYYE